MQATSEASYSVVLLWSDLGSSCIMKCLHLETSKLALAGPFLSHRTNSEKVIFSARARGQARASEVRFVRPSPRTIAVREKRRRDRHEFMAHGQRPPSLLTDTEKRRPRRVHL